MDTAPLASGSVTPFPGGDAHARMPPHNDEAEMALLGAVLHNNQAFSRVSDFLEASHFANRVHGRIYEAIAKLIDRGQIADPITLKQFFDADSDLVEVGGYAYLLRLAGSVPSIINALDYARTIHDLYLRRQLIDLGEEIVNDAFSEEIEIDAKVQLTQAEEKLFALATKGEVEGGFKPFGQVIKASIDAAELAFKRDGQMTGVPTGFTDIDQLLGGLHKSDLLILAARPSMGKTALATNIAFNAARTASNRETGKRHEIAFFSLEMSAEQLATRMLADATGISSEHIRRGDLSNDDFGKLTRSLAELQNLSFFIDDTPALPISAVRTRARRLKRQHGLSLIIVDYLQLLRGSTNTREQNRVQEISDITRGLKAIAKELDVPVIALSQLSRAVENREDKRPQLADLRESGSIEQDADVVMFIYREEYYLARKEPTEGTPEHETWQAEMARVHNLAEVIVAKQRHGPIGKKVLQFDGATTRFSTYVAGDYLPADNYE